MYYDLDVGCEFMNCYGLVIIMLVYIEDVQMFYFCNVFVLGGVFEDFVIGVVLVVFVGYFCDK